MFGTKRLAKRSIVGTRIAAKWQDGRFYPGVIRAEYAEETPFSDSVYSVLFEDGYEKNISSKHIIGQGFQNTTSAILKNGQKVFLTLNGREVSGVVIQHRVDIDEVLVNVPMSSGEEIEIMKKLDEVRLMKSRKSARLVDQDTDYSKLADLQLSEAKKRTVSSGIDVPIKHMRHWQSQNETPSSDPDQDNNNNTNIISSSNNGGGDDVEMMDENIAALVLTSLSCSPQSPAFNDLRDMHAFNASRQDANTQLSSSASSSGFYSNQSERSDPSPPSSSHLLSESAPAGSGMMFDPFSSHDEGLELEEEGKENEGNPRTGQKKTMFQCTWPGCEKISSTCSGIEKHIRHVHLKSDMEDDSGGSGGGSDSDREEEFYYTEIEVNVDNVTQGFSDMCTSQASPPTHSSIEHRPVIIPDHDYQKKVFASSVPSISVLSSHPRAVPIPVRNSEIQRSLSWQNTHSYASSPSPPIRLSTKPSAHERLQQHQAQSPKLHSLSPPKMMSIHKKPRSEVRKCRKVYGMENRDMWCTQCKWKKACSRFLD